MRSRAQTYGATRCENTATHVSERTRSFITFSVLATSFVSQRVIGRGQRRYSLLPGSFPASNIRLANFPPALHAVQLLPPPLFLAVFARTHQQRQAFHRVHCARKFSLVAFDRINMIVHVGIQEKQKAVKINARWGQKGTAYSNKLSTAVWMKKYT